MGTTEQTMNTATSPAFSEEIKELQAAIALDPTDIVMKISLASQLETEGFLAEAAEVYRDIVASDHDGVFAASAQQALLALGEAMDVPASNGSGNNGDRPAGSTNGNGTVATTNPPEEAQAPLSVEVSGAKDYSPEILALQAAIDADPTDMVAQISFASALESEGFFPEAIAIYQQIIDQDPEGIFAASAAKALGDLQAQLPQSDPETDDPSAIALPDQAPKPVALVYDDVDYTDVDVTSPPLKRLQNLSIAQKQFIGIFVSSAIAIAGVVAAGAVIIVTSGRSQLREQATSELAVNDINYNVKIDQMGFGFRGQSDNAAIIAAAAAYQSTGTVPPEQLAQVQAILQNEIQARNIEYATLVSTNLRIITNGNGDRQGEVFDPNGLVTQALQTRQQLKTSELLSWDDLNREVTRFPIGTKKGEFALVRYTVTPVIGSNDNLLGALVSGDVIFNAKLDIAANTVSAFNGGYSAIYQVNPDGGFQLASALYQQDAQEEGEDSTRKVIQTSLNAPDLLTLPDFSFLTAAVNARGETVVDTQVIDGISYTLAAESILNSAGEPVAIIVRGTDENTLNALIQDSLLLQTTVGLIGVFVAAGLAWLLGRTITRPIKRLQKVTTEFGAGNLDARAEVFAKDEVGQLATTFNNMAAQIRSITDAVEAQAQAKDQEAAFQRQERERLQEGVIRLLLQIEEVRQGNLTVQAMVDEGEVGSIADAFNATLRSLRALVSQVKSSADEVYDLAIVNNDLITRLSTEATVQEQAIQSAERSVQGIAQSIQAVAKSAQGAAQIARKSRLAAQEGQATMDETVTSIDLIRGSVADTSKKAKRLAESSQEISKIVNIISDISEKTNLLAFNASIEATRAGENGQGFRVVADEVRRLAEQVTTAAQEVEQLIGGIQEETAQMMQMMEESTSQVVTGTELVKKTKTTLQSVSRISEEIDKVLARISKAMVSQRDVSGKVTKIMQSAAEVAQKTAAESQTMSGQLDALTQVAIALKDSSSRFEIE
ncbi:methyl-accepting chemotaxis protein [Synechococcus sp. BDU 130192]|uniref:methyl-accepting chemotaxis protein n=1 Tax=Synechococcus sp. BDU 130192 TaxID=2042059 RepID=UPI0020B11471|nr:methyl-accepting chemotaxis protein [Synechococcus sp. BDU 130192]